jgi:hypothetical protein
MQQLRFLARGTQVVAIKSSTVEDTVFLEESVSRCNFLWFVASKNNNKYTNNVNYFLTCEKAATDAIRDKQRATFIVPEIAMRCKSKCDLSR